MPRPLSDAKVTAVLLGESTHQPPTIRRLSDIPQKWWAILGGTVTIILIVTLAVVLWQKTQAGPPQQSHAGSISDNNTTPQTPLADPTAANNGIQIALDSDRREPDSDQPAAGDPRATYTGPGADIANAAGLSNPNNLRASESITARTDGQVIENLDVTGVLNVQANNVTIRNVRVRTTSLSGAINVKQGFAGTTIEHAEILLESTDLRGSAAGVAGNGDHAMEKCTKPGDNVTVRNSFIIGNGDGLKAVNCSLYEGNYTRVYKLPDSPAHIDGIQGSGVSRVVVQNNVFDQMIAPGQNAAIFFQSYTGKRDKDITDITVAGNFVAGGSFALMFSDGKKSTGRASNITVNDNTFLGQWRYGAVGGTAPVTGNLGKLIDGRTAKTGEQKPPF